MVCFIYNFKFSVKLLLPYFIYFAFKTTNVKKIGIFLRIMNKKFRKLENIFSYYPEQKNKKLNCGPKNLLQKTKNK